MASVHRKPRSPYWHAKFTDEHGRVRWQSTKETHRAKALQMALEFERMAKAARKGELTRSLILKVGDDMLERLGLT